MVKRQGVLAIAFAASAACGRSPAVGLPPADGSAVAADIAWLASPLLDGRATGSAGNDSAALYIGRSYVEDGLGGAFPAPSCTEPPCRMLFDQLFLPPPDALREARIRADAAARNIAAIVPGADPALHGEYIVVGAHFDHLGRTGFGTLDGEGNTQPHLGADDNASGTAAVLELARRLALKPVRRSVVLVNFGAEELGLFGSRAFVRRPPIPLDSVCAMLNIDMVGRLRSDRVFVYGLASSRQWPRVLQGANAATRLWIDMHDERAAPGTDSDHGNFIDAGIPAVHFTTGEHADYHTVRDRADRIDVGGEMRVIALIENVLRIVGDSAAVRSPRCR